MTFVICESAYDPDFDLSCAVHLYPQHRPLTRETFKYLKPVSPHHIPFWLQEEI